ncbi:MAG: PKD domain-containing protein, partial [Methanosarcinales archaeon]
MSHVNGVFVFFVDQTSNPNNITFYLDTLEYQVNYQVEGPSRVQVLKLGNGNWQLLVDNKPYIIKGVAYGATKVGQSPDLCTLADWMQEDSNKNGKPDGPYDSWVDNNSNNIQDPEEQMVGDFKLLKDMGVNTIRLYHHASNKPLLLDLYKNYGIRVIMGDLLGMYGIGSGATLENGTDYTNPEHQKNMLKSVTEMVTEFKDEPYILIWILGNENTLGVANNANEKPEAYYKFVNKVAKEIKKIDKNHPVAISNLDLDNLDNFSKYCPEVDIFGVNAYRGENGFGDLWEQVKNTTDKPVLITEYGCHAYNNTSLEIGEENQKEYHLGNWRDIQNNRDDKGSGNAIGGVIFEWMDEWWKAGPQYDPYQHDKVCTSPGPFPEGCGYDEWFGISGQGNGNNSPYLRYLRETYSLYKELWNKPFAFGTFFPENPVVNQIITFNASDSYDSDGYIVKYEWNFGDGTNETGIIVNHSYSSVGNYMVTLTVTDNDGAKDTYSFNLDPFVIGDFNGNGRVDIGDATYVAYMVVGKVPANLEADFNNNGKVDI